MAMIEWIETKVSTEAAEKKLAELKEVEERTTFHSKRLNATTVVYCKNEDRISDYEELYKRK